MRRRLYHIEYRSAVKRSPVPASAASSSAFSSCQSQSALVTLSRHQVPAPSAPHGSEPGWLEFRSNDDRPQPLVAGKTACAMNSAHASLKAICCDTAAASSPALIPTPLKP